MTGTQNATSHDDPHQALNRIIDSIPARRLTPEELAESLAAADERDRAAGRQEGEPPSFPYATEEFETVGTPGIATMTASGSSTQLPSRDLSVAARALADPDDGRA